MGENSELNELRAELEALRTELSDLREVVRQQRSGPTPTGQRPAPSGIDDRSTSRRDLIRLAGGAVVVGAAGAVAASKPVAADDPNDVTFGQIKSHSIGQTTARLNDGAGLGDHAFMFQAGGNDAGFVSDYPSALAGWSDDISRQHGVYGRAMGGANLGIGVVGEGTTGVRGIGFSTGVAGRGNIGVIGRGVGIANIGVVASGEKASLFLASQNPAPPATTNFNHDAGEIVVENAGSGIDPTTNFWGCVGAGNPGTWRKLAGIDTAGSLHLIEPTRVYDSRQPQPAPGQLSAGANRTISVADGRNVNGGAVTNPNLIPAGATAISYNLTLDSTVGAGFLSVAPGDAVAAKASAINWTSSGLAIANAGLVKLDTNRQIKVFCGTGATHFIIDVTGYYL